MKKKVGNSLKSVEKALRIIESFELDRPEISVAEFVEKLSMPKVSVYRFLRVLAKNGFINQNKQTKNYRLGLKIFELGSIVLKNFDFREVAFPLLTELSKRSGETVHLGVLDAQQVVSIESVESNQALRISMPSTPVTGQPPAQVPQVRQRSGNSPASFRFSLLSRTIVSPCISFLLARFSSMLFLQLRRHAICAGVYSRGRFLRPFSSANLVPNREELKK